MKKNEKATMAVLVIVLCAIVLGAAGVLVFLSSGMNTKIEESEQKVQQLQERADTVKQELEESRSEAEPYANTDGGELPLETGNERNAEINVSSIKDLQLGSIIPAEEISPFAIDTYFQDYEITEEDEIYARIIGKSYRLNDNVSLPDLRYMKVIHYNFDNEMQVGELIVDADLAEDLKSAFQQLTGGGELSMHAFGGDWEHLKDYQHFEMKF